MVQLKICENDGKTITKDLARHIENLIIQGHFDEDTQMFTHVELARFYGVCRVTARRVYDLLEARGFIERYRGRGMFLAFGAKERCLEMRRDNFRCGIFLEFYKEAVFLDYKWKDIENMVDEYEKELDKKDASSLQKDEPQTEPSQ